MRSLVEEIQLLRNATYRDPLVRKTVTAFEAQVLYNISSQRVADILSLCIANHLNDKNKISADDTDYPPSCCIILCVYRLLQAVSKFSDNFATDDASSAIHNERKIICQTSFTYI